MDGGDWWRKWMNVTDAKPASGDTIADAVCDNCHGTWRSSWRWDEGNLTTTDHSDPYSTNTGDAMNASGKHPDCEICHGYGGGSYDDTWGVDHGNSLINMNGPSPDTGAAYNDALGGCEKGCHAPPPEAFAMNTNSGWTVTYGDYGGGACNSCHGYPPMDPSFDNSAPSFYDDASTQDYNFGGGSHTVAGHIDPTVLIADAWDPCNKCHDNGGSHAMNTDLLSAQNGSEVTVVVDAGYQIGPSAPSYDGSTGPLPTVGPPWKTCDNVSCHYGLSPDWAMRDQAGGDDLTISDGTPDPSGHIIDASGGAVADTVIDYLDFAVTGAGGSL
jgi:hypothetical protein